LKKRTKKLLSVTDGTDAAYVIRLLRAKVKSFLFLFSKKEILPYFAGVSISVQVAVTRKTLVFLR